MATQIKKFIEYCHKKNMEEIMEYYDYIKINFEDDIILNVDCIFIECCETGKLILVKWFWKIYEKEIKEYDKSFYEAFEQTCKKGHVDIAKWLMDISKIDISYKNYYIYKYCYKNGNFEIIKWMYDIIKNNILEINHNILFQIVCCKNNKDIAEWMINTINNNLEPEEKTIIEICRNENFEMLKWLLEIKKTKFPDDFINNVLFNQVCIYGKIDIVEYIWNLSNKNIQINNCILEWTTNDILYWLLNNDQIIKNVSFIDMLYKYCESNDIEKVKIYWNFVNKDCITSFLYSFVHYYSKTKDFYQIIKWLIDNTNLVFKVNDIFVKELFNDDLDFCIRNKDKLDNELIKINKYVNNPKLFKLWILKNSSILTKSYDTLHDIVNII